MANGNVEEKGHGWGTSPVFLAGVSTILGAVLFLRFGYAVGNVGLFGAVLIILLGHTITIPTGLAVSEIATNLKVQGGGEYFIISRSFGATVGGAIGTSLYFSQSIAVSFYIIAFSEAFRPLFPWFEAQFGFEPNIRFIAIPAFIVLAIIIFVRGASIGVTVLWVVVGILAISLGMFFAGKPTPNVPESIGLFQTVPDPDSFFKVFAIVFPAFTGMNAGVGLSGDLRNPSKSIPLGVLAAALTGMGMYLLVIVKLAFSASPAEMVDPVNLVMANIAIWSPIVPIGLAAATISSAIGAFLVAPRTLQALGRDGILPWNVMNRFIARGRGKANEPANGLLVTSVIILFFISLGNVDVVARIISMFFMITYGALCSISFLEHFAGNPSYRPKFRTKWYLSLVGALAAFIVMFLMNALAALVAFAAMTLLYFWLRASREGERDLAAVVKGVLFQMTRKLQVTIQRREAQVDMTNWRPSFIALSGHSLQRLAAFDTLRWISHYYGFGSYIHFVEGPLDEDHNREAEKIKRRLVQQAQHSNASLHVDTIISPSFRTAVAQIVQIPGIAGMDNNSILLEFARDDSTESLKDLIDGCTFARIAGMNICVLRSSERNFGYHRKIHIWLRPGDYRNTNLMILLAYILLAHPQWRNGEIKVFDTYNPESRERSVQRLDQLIEEGRIPISLRNVQLVPHHPDQPFDTLACEVSQDADLVITGFSVEKLERDGGEYLQGFNRLNDMLFVRAGEDILITEPTDPFEPDPEELEELLPKPGEDAEPPEPGGKSQTS